MYRSNVIKPLSDDAIVQYAEAVQPSITLTESAPDAAQQVTLKATVTPGPGSTAAPTGTVTFEWVVPPTSGAGGVYSTALGVVPIDASGVATLDINPALYDHSTLYAVYNGDQFTDARVSTGLADVV